MPKDAHYQQEPARESERDVEPEQEREEEIRRLLDEQGGDPNTFNPRTGEDPGLLPLTEDPQERRVKRTTM